MLPTLYPAKLVNDPAGAPSSVCRTNAGGTVMHAVDCASRTCSTTSIRGKNQFELCPSPVEMMATAGLERFIQFILVLLSLPWWLAFSTSMPPELISGNAPPGEIA